MAVWSLQCHRIAVVVVCHCSQRGVAGRALPRTCVDRVTAGCSPLLLRGVQKREQLQCFVCHSRGGRDIWLCLHVRWLRVEHLVLWCSCRGRVASVHAGTAAGLFVAVGEVINCRLPGCVAVSFAVLLLPLRSRE